LLVFCIFKILYNLRKKNYFHRRFKKKNTGYFYNEFSKHRKLVKTTVKADKLAWLRSINNDLKLRPTRFWKYVSRFRKNNSTVIQLHVGGTCLDNPEDVVEAFVHNA
jgi:hypothetical protein